MSEILLYYVRGTKMANLIELLKETMILKNLSPERAAPFIGCTGRQVRRWMSGESNPGQVHSKAIEAGIRKINREIAGDTPEGLVSWRSAKISGEEKAINRAVETKVTAFLIKLVKAARSSGQRTFTHQDDENFLGFEEICLLAKKLKVKLPVI